MDKLEKSLKNCWYVLRDNAVFCFVLLVAAIGISAIGRLHGYELFGLLIAFILAFWIWSDWENTKERFNDLATRVEVQKLRISDLNSMKNSAYSERNHLVAILARLYPSGLRPTYIEDWDPAWNNCVYIELPTGQVSFHYHDSEAYLFEGLPVYSEPYDGHTKHQAMKRLKQTIIFKNHAKHLEDSVTDIPGLVVMDNKVALEKANTN